MKKCLDNSIFIYPTHNEGKLVIGNSWEVCKDLKNKIFKEDKKNYCWLIIVKFSRYNVREEVFNFYLDYFFKVGYVMIKIL